MEEIKETARGGDEISTWNGGLPWGCKPLEQRHGIRDKTEMGRQGIQPLSLRRKSHAGGFSSGLPICAIPETFPMQQSDRTAVCPM